MQLLKVAEREFEIALDDAALDSADFGVWWPIERKHTERSRNIRVRRLAVRKGLVSKFKQIPFAQFYRDHLKKYAGVRWLARRLNWFKVYSSYVNLLTAVLYSKHAREWRKVLALADFVKKKGVASCDLVDAEQIEIPQPMVYPSGAREYPASFLDQYSFPRLFVATINDAKVYGGTNLILADDGMVICHDLYDFAHDYTAEELHGLTFHDHDNKHIRWLSYDEAPEVVPICATFVDACAVNYAHWLTEVLPRIALFCSDR
ncbi:MAG: hypothetical protein H3C69_09745, partial [Candidatus Promineofilum sp.]|nr:hypothetical protein [Promineifilum sp.]